jgi:type I restriction enzyme R subunit
MKTAARQHSPNSSRRCAPPDTPIIVERLVTRIDEIVRLVRFPGWQDTSEGEREVRKALRRTLFAFKLHQDRELFDKAYGYIRLYY